MIELIEDINFNGISHEPRLTFPTGLAILPQNFFDAKTATELFYNEELKTINKMFLKEGIEDVYCKNELGPIGFKAQKSSQILLPTLFVSGMLMTQNPHLVAVAINILSTYATDMLKGIPKRKQRVKLEVVCEKSESKTYSKISFEGDPDSLKDLPRIIREISKK